MNREGLLFLWPHLSEEPMSQDHNDMDEAESSIGQDALVLQIDGHSSFLIFFFFHVIPICSYMPSLL